VAYLNDLIVDLKKQLDSTFVVVTHNIPTARNISDYIGMLFRSNLVMFGPTEEMFNTDKPVVHQFLHGEVAGPIGMSEEGDAGDIGEGEQEALQAEEAPEAEEGADDEKETVTAG
jgi:phospholipid/cholesterol/gamma-HCH transport system ATP-binding protein